MDMIETYSNWLSCVAGVVFFHFLLLHFVISLATHSSLFSSLDIYSMGRYLKNYSEFYFAESITGNGRTEMARL